MRGERSEVERREEGIMGVYVRALGERGAKWRELYGTDTLPVESRRPEPTTVKGESGVLAFVVDFEALDEETRARVARGAAKAADLPLEVVEGLFIEQGFPIVVQDGPLQVWSD